MNLVYILSQPRSGSTVLTALLDKRKGVVCMPESSFPQVLGQISGKELGDRRWLAALYLGSTFPPTPLTLDDAERCMTGSEAEILCNLGKALASELGRNPDEVRHVVWKTTRMVGMHQGPVAAGGRFGWSGGTRTMSLKASSASFTARGTGDRSAVRS